MVKGFLSWIGQLLAICLLVGASPSVKADVKGVGLPASSGSAQPSHGEGGDHGSAPHDPTHAYAGAMQSNPMEFRSDGALFSLLVFLALLATLGAFAWKPISEGLAKRESSIAQALEDAKKASETATATMQEYQAKIAAAQAQASDIVSEARKAAESAGQRIVSEAQAEAARQRDRALAEIETAKQAALSELAGRSTDMAFGLARQVVGRELNPGDHQKLIQDALQRMPSRN
jgi:F-type H+-transporting ATPase subunit b